MPKPPRSTRPVTPEEQARLNRIPDQLDQLWADAAADPTIDLGARLTEILEGRREETGA